MDPVTAIGLAGAIVNLLDMGGKVAKRLFELSEAGEVPKAFRDIRTRLPLILQIVKRTSNGLQDLTEDEKKSLEAVVGQCYEQVIQLEAILSRITASENENKWRKGAKAILSLVEENRVERIKTALMENVETLTFLSMVPAEKESRTLPKEPAPVLELPPTYAQATGLFLVPFDRDDHFVGRKLELDSIREGFSGKQRVAVAGIGGVGKSQVAIEYCYRYRLESPTAHVFWVFGGNQSRFYQAYRRIAQALDLPGWDDPDTSILQLVSDWFADTSSAFLLVVDNADNMDDWWPGKSQSTDVHGGLQESLSKYLPQIGNNNRVLITSRDARIANRLARQGRTVSLQPMSQKESRELFLSKAQSERNEYDDDDVDTLLSLLDHIPLAISQAAAFIEENCITISDYLDALKGDDSEEFLNEELADSRRDEDSLNSIFRTWKLSFDTIQQQKPKAAELLSLFAVLDRQSIPKALFKDSIEFKGELTTAIGTLQSFNMITVRASKDSYQLHRLVHRFVQSSLQRSKSLERWQAVALRCVSSIYPTEIGVDEWDTCDMLAPHVQILIENQYKTRESNLDLAHILCWAADFDIERGLYQLALARSKRSLDMFRVLVPEDDERRVAATWLYGRLRYYEALSDTDMTEAENLLQESLQHSQWPSMNYAESAFELAHLYYDERREQLSLSMGSASFEAWKGMEGPSSKRTLDNMHDFALELAMFGHEEEAIDKWNELLALCPASQDASENTRNVFELRTLASIAEFSGDAALAEFFYQKLITLCSSIYNDQHIHLYDYRLSIAEQVLRQGRFKEAIGLSKDILSHCQNSSEWQIRAGCLQTMAECYRLQKDFASEEASRKDCLELYERVLGRSREETIDALEAEAACFIHTGKAPEADLILSEVIAWRAMKYGFGHASTICAVEWHAICAMARTCDADGEARFLDALDRSVNPQPRLLINLCVVLEKQKKWDALEERCKQAIQHFQANQHSFAPKDGGSNVDLSVYHFLAIALEQQGKTEEALAIKAEKLSFEVTEDTQREKYRECVDPPLLSMEKRRFGRMIHPRTWSS